MIGWDHVGLRRFPLAVLRRPGRARRRIAVSAERDQGPGGPARAAALGVLTALSGPATVGTARGSPSAGPLVPPAGGGLAGGGRCAGELREAARLITERARPAHPDFDLAYQSRSGPPSVPWLGPDIRDHLADIAAKGVPGVVVVPVGFTSDHMEVVHDL